MQDCKPKSIPCEPNIYATLLIDSPLYENPTEYRELIGSLIYLMYCTCPDIAYVTSLLAKFMSSLKCIHMKLVKDILRYLKHTIHYDIKYIKSKDPLY